MDFHVTARLSASRCRASAAAGLREVHEALCLVGKAFGSSEVQGLCRVILEHREMPVRLGGDLEHIGDRQVGTGRGHTETGPIMQIADRIATWAKEKA